MKSFLCIVHTCPKCTNKRVTKWLYKEEKDLP
jgi:hypothetical protein